MLIDFNKTFRIEKEKLSSKIREQKDCTFAPELNQLDVEIFNFDVKSDQNVKRYIERLDKAKKIKEEINTKYNPDYSKNKNLNDIDERYEKLIKNKIKIPKENAHDTVN